MRICFFNHFHNGDLVANREFLKWAHEAWPGICFYTHVNNPKVLSDVPMPFYSMPDILKLAGQERHKIIQHNGVIYANLWIGSYMAWASQDHVVVTDPITGLNWPVYYRMWLHVVGEINKVLNTEVRLPQELEYFINNPIPEFYVNQQFLESKINLQKISVLISNGPALSGQSLQNHNMSSWFAPLITRHPQVQWIFTHTCELQAANVFYTNDIFEHRGCDLNEIAELSKYCKIIVGRNSGPFLFCNIRDNLYDPAKTFVAMGRVRGDCFPAGLRLPCDYYWICDNDTQLTEHFLHEIITNKLYFQEQL